MGATIGIDIGGTFTDGLYFTDDGRVAIGKVPSTPPTFDDGFIDAIGAAAAAADSTLEEVVSGADGIYHGSTIAVNALVEGRAARCAMLTTKGHRDTHGSMQSGKRLSGQPAEVIARVSQQLKPPPLVPKSLIFEINERVASDGAILSPLNEEQAIEMIDAAVGAGVDAIAVCLIWSVTEPAHELRLRELIAARAPGVFVSLSHEVAARTGEYERGVATILNSMVGPITGDYVNRLEERLGQLGYRGRLQIMSSSGGLIDAGQARRFPVLTLGSGPVAGLVGSAKLGEQLAEDGAGANVIATDMGGTTFDIGIVREGDPIRKSVAFFGEFAYSIPQIDMRSVGSGGGSIIHYEANSGTLKVGPRSAGARPGPACYGRGGDLPTVTDADLLLGYLNADRFAGGSIGLDLDAARTALETVGRPLGMSAEEVAAAAARIVDNQMADAIRLATIQQGLDPRDFTIYAYGGAGPVHATGYAAELEVEEIVIPQADLASGWSAFGVANSDALVTVERALPMRAPFDPSALNDAWKVIEDEARGRLLAGGIPAEQISIERFAGMLFSGQIHEIEVALPGGSYDEDVVAGLPGLFDSAYAEIYGAGTGFAAAGCAITSVSVRARAAVSSHALTESACGGKVEPLGMRQVIWYERGGEKVETPIYRGLDVTRGVEITGPAVVEFPDTTVIVRDGQLFTLDRLGNGIVIRGGGGTDVEP